jgi:hypothetical protein
VVDTPDDYARAVRLVEKLGGRHFPLEDLLATDA